MIRTQEWGKRAHHGPKTARRHDGEQQITGGADPGRITRGFDIGEIREFTNLMFFIYPPHRFRISTEQQNRMVECDQVGDGRSEASGSNHPNMTVCLIVFHGTPVCDEQLIYAARGNYFTAVSVRQLMARWIILFVLCLFSEVDAFAQSDAAEQGWDAQTMAWVDYGSGRDGFSLFYPTTPVDSACEVVVFLHGYGAYNPMLYGGWISHLVRRGHVVVFPFYQDNLFLPRPEAFTGLAAKAIRKALEWAPQVMYMPTLKRDRIHYIGHSYGGTISAGLAAHSALYQIPEPGAMLLCMPGTGPFSAGQLRDYAGIPLHTVLGLVVGQDDEVVGYSLAERIYQTTPPELRKVFFSLAPQAGSPALSAHHNEAYSLLEELDNGRHNYNYWRGFMVGQTDAHDRNGLWRWFDQLVIEARERAPNSWSADQLATWPFLGEDQDGEPYGPVLMRTAQQPADEPSSKGIH